MAHLTARRTLASSLFRALYSSSSSSSAIASRSRSRFALAIHAKQTPLGPPWVNVPIRFQTSESANPPLNDSTKNSKSSAPKGTIILEGCDLEHWLIIMEFPENPKPSEEEMVNTYVKTLAEVVGSEEEAKKKIYSVSTTTYKGFGALISEELSAKVKGLPGVLWVLPDSYLDVPNKDYGGDLFVDGKVIPRPKYRFTEKQSTDNKSGPQNNRRNERRQSSQRHNRTQGQREPTMLQSAPNNNIHNSASGGEA